MNQKEKIDTLIGVAKKYKIDMEPYTRIEWLHPRTGRYEVVEFGDIKESDEKELGKLAWFLLGMGWASLVSWVTWWFIRF